MPGEHFQIFAFHHDQSAQLSAEPAPPQPEAFLGGDSAVIRKGSLQLGMIEAGQFAFHQQTRSLCPTTGRVIALGSANNSPGIKSENIELNVGFRPPHLALARFAQEIGRR